MCKTLPFTLMLQCYIFVNLNSVYSVTTLSNKLFLKIKISLGMFFRVADLVEIKSHCDSTYIRLVGCRHLAGSVYSVNFP